MGIKESQLDVLALGQLSSGGFGSSESSDVYTHVRLSIRCDMLFYRTAPGAGFFATSLICPTELNAYLTEQ